MLPAIPSMEPPMPLKSTILALNPTSYWPLDDAPGSPFCVDAMGLKNAVSASQTPAGTAAALQKPAFSHNHRPTGTGPPQRFSNSDRARRRDLQSAERSRQIVFAYFGIGRVGARGRNRNHAGAKRRGYRSDDDSVCATAGRWRSRDTGQLHDAGCANFPRPAAW